MTGIEIRAIVPRNKIQNGSFKNKPIQACCYDNRNKRFVIGFSHTGDPEHATLMASKDLSFQDESIELIRENLDLKHCNDMAYDAVGHRILIARGDNKIAVVQPESLTITSLIAVDVSVWAIAIYSNGQIFIFDGDNAWLYGSDFKRIIQISSDMTNKLTRLAHVAYDPISKCPAGDWQGAFIYRDSAFMIYTEWNGITDQIDKNGTLVYNGDTRFRSCIIVPTDREERIHRFKIYYEIENACVIENELYYLIGNEYIGYGTSILDMDDKNDETSETIYQELATGCDLNSILTPGRYRSKNGGKSATIQHLPKIGSFSEVGFYLEVKNAGLNHIRQTIYANDFWDTDIICTRGYSYDYGWGHWYKYKLEKV